MAVTGRIDGVPSEVWDEEVLAPQFGYEAEALLPHYVSIEKVLLLEYRRMGLVDQEGTAAIAGRLDELTPELIRADPRDNMSDIFFAMERHVARGGTTPFAAWHVDRSRNDFQACGQLLSSRENVRALADGLIAFGRTVAARAAELPDSPMPGYTHAQAAQTVTPAFYLSALSEETLDAARRLLATYDGIDRSPLGAGSMAGQELPWDRERMAALLGFRQPQPHALMAVASRSWALGVASELSTFAVLLSRFTTDLMTWSGAGFGFVDFPDDLAGISAAMPQKRNFPVLERIRGRCSHVVGCAAQLAFAQHGTPYANSVEVSKEAGRHLREQFAALRSALRLAHTALATATFRTDRMREACEGDFLGAFTLANRLTLEAGVPWRTAQVIAGAYVRAAIAKGLTAATPDGPLLAAVAEEHGHRVPEPGALLAGSLDADRAVRVKRSTGSTHPDAVRAMLAAQDRGYREVAGQWRLRAETASAAAARVDALLADASTDGPTNASTEGPTQAGTP
ncbi:argininosuccinate lyase [Kitasatospora xanthocidica]|uniref:argininosuccinate lyase n=1 Tax=Kitasatospora xanthocidica TaxID=83382 RepID=UPI0016795039|nr:lyase family protein [Kitasatospora xanthocidica]GHF37095.1 argininosuccinate lyase [Kitasatospora xanthocidica]